MRAYAVLGWCVVLTCVGCDELKSGAPVASSPAPAGAAVDVVPAGQILPVGSPTQAADPAASAPGYQSAAAGQVNPYNPASGGQPDSVNAVADYVDPAAITNPPPVREKAEAGVGVRGDTIGEGIYSTPARAYFQTRERLIFIQVEQAINLYRGAEGSLPKTHEEFMEKIIQANQIQLPELSNGSTYVWDAEKGELMVERPRQ